MASHDASNDELPTHFYKYRSLDGTQREWTRKIIAENALWFSKPDSFNDPFDCAPPVSMTADADARSYMESVLRERRPYISRKDRRAIVTKGMTPGLFPKLLERLRDGAWKSANLAGILCLSARSDHLLMWAHYASSHTGICLRFRARAMPFLTAIKVKYSKQRPIVNPGKDGSDANALLEKSFLTKAECWAYEEEWRAISHPGGLTAPGPGLVPFDPTALDGIILGARISDADATEVRQWVAGRRQAVEIMQARPSAYLYEIEVGSPP